MLRLMRRQGARYSVCMTKQRTTEPNKNDHSTSSERELVLRAQSGDAEAFGQIYESLIDPVYRYIYFRVSDDSTAEDLASQVFLKAWEHLPRYHPEASPFLAWIYTIAHNAVIDFYRVRRPATPLEEIEAVSSRDRLPDDECEFRLDSQVLKHALQALTGEQREVIVMRLIDGMGTEEIAARLGKRPGAIRAAQMRGLQALARMLQAEYTPQPQAEVASRL